MNTSQGVSLIVFLLLSGFSVQCFRKHDHALDSSFLQGNVLDASNEMSEAVLTELELFNNTVLEKLAERMVHVLDKHGYDMNKRENVENLFNFLQNAQLEDTETKKPGFFRRLGSALKKAATGIGKEALIHSTRAMVAFGLKEALPVMEDICKKSLDGLPLDLRLAFAPIIYNLWKGVFKRARITPPKSFNFRNIVLDGLNEEDREVAKEYLDRRMVD